MAKLPESETIVTVPAERRKFTRYDIDGEVRCEWQAADGQRQEGGGVARNIGVEGAFVESTSLPPFGASLSLVITLRTAWQPELVACLRGNGDVRHLRLHTDQPPGYGVHAVFRTSTPDAAAPKGEWR
jgi:hypothetical protein